MWMITNKGKIMQKKCMRVLLCLLLCLSMAACGGKEQPASTHDHQPTYQIVSLTDQEKEILKAMGKDVQVISDADYASMVTELIYHTDSYLGTVYQLEGVFSIDGENGFVYRTLVNGEQTQILGLPLDCLYKQIDDGAWIRVTGIVDEDLSDGHHSTVLDVVAIETLATYGQDELKWDGSPVHQH